MDNTNSYARNKCNNDWCAYLYDLYFEKDQAVPGIDCCGHRHDTEHVVVWVGSHAKVIYHKDGASTHCRLR